MLPPTALLLSRYRAFAGDEVLPLRPLTLLYGRNNSGKSALTRALAMIGASITENANAALLTPPELIRGGTFTDIAWQGDAGDYSFDLGLRWDDGEVREVRYTLDGSAGRSAYVKELWVRGEGGQVLWTGRAAPGRPLRADHGDSDLHLIGLVPHEPRVPALQALATRLIALRGRVRWLDGLRERPERRIPKIGVSPTKLMPNGGNAAAFLVESPDLIEEIRQFYARLEPSRDLEVKEVLDVGYQISLSLKNSASFRVDLLDTGEGMVQVLPVLVATALAARDGALLAVEEPESHLHLDAQRVLAQYLCQMTTRPKPPILILETHSRVFLLGVQLAIAKQQLPCDHVSLAWVDQDSNGRSSITPVELSPSGHPREGWPVAALGEDFQLAGELAKLNLQHRV